MAVCVSPCFATEGVVDSIVNTLVAKAYCIVNNRPTKIYYSELRRKYQPDVAPDLPKHFTPQGLGR